MNTPKTLSTILLALLAIISATAQPRIFWRETFHDFGAFNEDDGNARTTFRYINTGTEPLIITGARTTCGCTLADYSRRPLAPGDSAEITVEYDPTGRLGRFEKGIIVDTNTDPRRTRLTIKGTVVGGEASVRAQYPVPHGPLALQKASALVGDVTKGHMKTVFINAYNQSNDTIAPEIAPLPDWLHISLEPSRIPPGQQASFIIYFRSDRCPVWGIDETPAIITPDPGLEPFTLPVVASVVEDFSKLTDKQLAKAPAISFSPAKIELPPTSRNAGTVQTSIRITNRGQSKLIIRRIWSPDQGISATLPAKNELKPGKSIEIPIAVNPAELPGDILNARLTIISNDPANPVANVRIVGEIIP